MNTFFDKYTGVDCDKHALVSEDDRRVVFDLNVDDAQSRTVALTPNQAKQLGRALIKAGKFAEKPNAQH